MKKSVSKSAAKRKSSSKSTKVPMPKFNKGTCGQSPEQVLVSKLKKGTLATSAMKPTTGKCGQNKSLMKPQKGNCGLNNLPKKKKRPR